jgi:putative PIN family toxin of toxin-antitoxin system
MQRVVVDTNIRISSILRTGVPGLVLQLLQPPNFIPLLSEPLLGEFHRILLRKTSASEGEIVEVVQRAMRTAEIITPSIVINVCRDPDDNRILECALSGHADIIITGDKDLLILHPFQNIKILTPRQFLDILPAALAPPPNQLP